MFTVSLGTGFLDSAQQSRTGILRFRRACSRRSMIRAMWLSISEQVPKLRHLSTSLGSQQRHSAFQINKLHSVGCALSSFNSNFGSPDFPIILSNFLSPE